MDALAVTKALNETWSNVIEDYYDTIATNYIEFLSKEYEIPINELKEKIAPLKNKLINNASMFSESTEKSRTKKEERKTTIKIPGTINKYSSKSRKELVEMCKSRKLPVKRKNQDMIDSLIESGESEEPQLPISLMHDDPNNEQPQPITSTMPPDSNEETQHIVPIDELQCEDIEE